MSQNSTSTNSTVISKEQVTTFHDDSTLDVTSMPQTLPNSLLVQSELNSLTSICGRPTRVLSGSWSSTVAEVPLIPVDMTSLPSLAEVDLPGALFAANSAIRDKLSNFSFLRTKLKARLQVNGEPTQLGKMLLVWRPMESIQGSKNLCHNSKTGISVFPHVEIDANSGNSVELEIPFAHPYNALNLRDATSQYLGTLHLVVINKLTSVTLPTTASYTLWVWMDDPVVSVPTAAPIVFPTVRKFNIGEKTYIKQEAIRPVAQVMDDASSQHKTFSQLPGAAYTNIDSNDQSVELAAFRGTSTSTPVLDNDDSIAAICKREAIVGTFNWKKEDAVDATLAYFPVSPQCAPYSGGVSFNTPLSFLSLLFAFWRGSLIYRFSAAKTIFHSGRLRISFTPNFTGTNYSSSDNNYSFVWDLRKQSEIAVRVPFVSSTLMKYCQAHSSTAVMSESVGCGTLTVSVINPLVYSEAVPSTIPINCWISSDDMKFRCNVLLKQTPVFIPTPTPPRPVAQVLVDDDNDANMGVSASHLIMKTNDADGCNYVTSEQIASLSEMVKRFTIYTSFDAPSNVQINIPHSYTSAPALSTVRSLYYGSMLDFVSLCFTFVSGSQRWKVLSTQSDTGGDALLIARAHPTGSRIETTGPVTSVYPETMSTVVNSRLNNMLECSAPWFTNAPFMPYDNGTVFNDVLVNTVSMGVLGSIGSAVLFRAGGPDFKFGFFTGPPATMDG